MIATWPESLIGKTVVVEGKPHTVISATSRPAPATLTTRLRMLDAVGAAVLPSGRYRCTIDSVSLDVPDDDTPRAELEADVDAIMADLQRRERGGVIDHSREAGARGARMSRRRAPPPPLPTAAEPCLFCRTPMIVGDVDGGHGIVVDPTGGDPIARRQIVRCGDDACPAWRGEQAAAAELRALGVPMWP